MATSQRAVRSSASPKRRRLSLQLALSLLLLGAAIGLSSYVLLADEQARAASSVETRILGRHIEPSGDVAATALRLARAYLRAPITLHAAERRRTISRAALGVDVDLARLTELLAAARDASSPLRRFHAQQRPEEPLTLPMPAQIATPAAARRWLEHIADELAEPAREMRVDLRTGALLPARPGRTLDVEGTLDALSDAVFRGRATASAQFETRKPPARGAAPSGPIDLAGLHGSFESVFLEGDRTHAHNLRACARVVDGALLGPSQVFDMRAQIAEALATRRFRPGPLVVDELDAIEAAVAQIAGTLHAAALLAGLPIVEHAPLAWPSGSLELGFDAAISPRHNLRFKNDLAQPLAIGVDVKDGRVRAVVRGSVRALRDVELERAIDEVTGFTEERRDDPTLPRGTRALAQRGVPGLRVLLIRHVRSTRDGERSDERTVVYPPRPQIVRVGSGPPRAGRALPSDAAGPALTFDEYVAYRMRRGFELPEVYARRTGRTGVPGWTLDELLEPDAP